MVAVWVGVWIRALKLEEINVRTNPVYYAPSLDLNSVKTIQPHYDCGGTAVIGGEIVNILHELIPAVDTIDYVPNVVLEAHMKGQEVSVEVNIEGGLSPC